jgi:site-specific DNA-methyltransferase (adenine-specific)
MKLYKGDCLQEMKKIESNSVDAIITDPPYGTTNRNNWDSVIDLKLMWEQLNRIIKPNGAIVLFCNEPFTSVLISSNLKGFKYRWDWNKKIPSGMGYAKYRPMQQTEDIAVFTKDGKKTIYNPQMIKRDKPIKAGGNNIGTMNYGVFNAIENKKEYKKTYDYKNPITLIEFDKIRKGALHPTQKPVPLMEYLIKTYTNENEIVLDFTMGSGSTMVACKNLNRNGIGIEKEEKYFNIASERINGTLF